jgi:hypothetical protein
MNINFIIFCIFYFIISGCNNNSEIGKELIKKENLYKKFNIDLSDVKSIDEATKNAKKYVSFIENEIIQTKNDSNNLTKLRVIYHDLELSNKWDAELSHLSDSSASVSKGILFAKMSNSELIQFYYNKSLLSD